MTQEIWKAVTGYEGLYEVSNLGNIKSLSFRNRMITIEREKMLGLFVSKNGYIFSTLSKQGAIKKHLLHRLVAQEFIANPLNKKTVNHKNGIKTDNRVENLEWMTHKENMRHAFKSGFNKSKNNHLIHNHPFKGVFGGNHYASVKVMQITKEGIIIKEWESISDIKRTLGINYGNISSCCSGKRKTAGGFIWKYTT